MSTVSILKRNSEDVACWRVSFDALTPNTVIDNASRLALIVKVNGQSKFSAQSSFTVHSLFHPGKDTKLLGGNKPYDSAEIIAIDFDSEFSAEWGVAGPNAIPTYDRENDAECKVIAFGAYFYKIDDYYSFFLSVPMSKDGKITRDDIREYMRAETTGIIKAHLTDALSIDDLKFCQKRLEQYSKDIVRKLNERLTNRGITVYNFVIHKMSYDKAYEEKRNLISEAKMEAKLNSIGNEMRLDDLRVEKAKADLEISYMKAANELTAPQAPEPAPAPIPEPTPAPAPAPAPAPKQEEPATIYCPRCGTSNQDALYCRKCGERLVK